MNTEYRLQLRSHKDVFSDRQSAMNYINRYFMPDNLVGEPTVFFYGDSENPNVILAIGKGDRIYSTIDIGETNERLDNIDQSQVDNTDGLEKAVATIKGIINAAGLTFDENKKENQVSYDPDVKDELIGDSQNLAEAISVLSKYVQENVKENHLVPANSKSIDLIYEPVENGMGLKAAIKISQHGESDETADNNNIIGLKSDGIYATVNVEYDEDKHELSFVTSGMKNGKFMDDANRKTINFGEHTQYTPDNNGYNVNLFVDKTKNTISANVKLSEDENNILKVQDSNLFVDGRANNIKYKGNTVYAGLNNLESEVDTINEEIETLKSHVEKVENHDVIVGDTTDTMVITAEKQDIGGYQISGGVRLGNNKTIITKDGGLEADIDITCDIAANKLILRTGNVSKSIDLPGVDVLDTAYYNSSTQEIVMKFHNGNEVRIPVGSLIILYSFQNTTTSPIVFSVNDGSRSTEKIVTASLRLASNDNMLSVNSNGELIAPVSTIDGKVKAETDRATEAEKQIGDALNAEITRAQAAEKDNADAIAAETARATQAEGEIKDTASSFRTDYDAYVKKADTVHTQLTEKVTSIDEKVTTNASNITKLEGNLNVEITRATGREDAIEKKLQDHIDSATSDIKSEVKTLQTDVADLKGRVSVNEEQIRVNTESLATTSGNVTSLQQEMVSVKSSIEAETTRAKGEEGRLEEKFDSLTTNNANAITGLTTKVDKNISDLADEIYRATTSENTISTNLAALQTSYDKHVADATNQYGELQAKDASMEAEIAKKIETVTVEKNSQNDLQYTVMVDGKPAGEINIPKDQFLKTVTYDSVSKKLQFVFVTKDGETTTDVNISDLIDTYTAGDGLSLEGNKFSVRKAELSEAYLTVSADGVSVNGIDAAIAQKANEAQTNAIQTASEDATAKANKALEDAKAYADKGLAVKANTADVYTKTQIDEKGFLTNASLSNYALKADLTEEVNRAKSAEKVNANDIDNLETRVLTAENSIASLQSEDKRLNLTANNTNSIALTVSKQDSGTTISGDVKINTAQPNNIIKVDGNGLFSSINLEYNKAENSISLIVNDAVVTKFTLSEHSLVTEGHYDSNTKSIVLTITKDGGDTEQISIPVGDIINDWKVDNGTNNPISLTKETGDDGVDILKAELEISTEAHNAILNNNGTLYVSNQAKDLTALWRGDEITIQKVIENLKTETDKVPTLVSDVATLKTDVAQAKNDITVLQGNVDTLNTKVEQNTSNIAENTGAISNLTTQITNFGEQVTNLTNKFDELNNSVNGYENRIAKLEGDVNTINNNINTISQTINQLKEQMGEPEEGKPTVYERLNTIEEIINNLIDFGEYENNSQI